MILGLDAAEQYEDRTIHLPPGSALVAYTDGLVEQVSKSGEQFGEIGVAAAAADALGTPEPMRGMLKDLLRRSIEPRFGDDILVFWLERQPVEDDVDSDTMPPPDPMQTSSAA
jgi:sigma-B regulation protein RsbU (phosphoserine phosphatase)